MRRIAQTEFSEFDLPYISAAVPTETLLAAWQLPGGFAALADTGDHNWLVIEGTATRLEYVRLLSSCAELGQPAHTAAIPTELAEQLQLADSRRWLWMWREDGLRSLPLGCALVEPGEDDGELSGFLSQVAPDAAVLPGDPEIGFWVVHRSADGELDAVAAGVTWNSGAAVISSVAVSPNRRRQGLGSCVTQVAASEHFVRGARRVCLGVRGTNIAAQEMYRRIGFDQDRDFTSVRLIEKD